MKDVLDLLLLPFLACLAIGGLHSYVGLHVVRRGVIFVDLSLAQIATLGAAFSMAAGHDVHAPITYVTSLAFALGGAVLFALTRTDERRIPQEAIIGIVWAISYAAVFVVLNRSAEGAEDLKNFMTGDLLAANRTDVIRLVAIYAGLGLLHVLIRKPLMEISSDHEGAIARGLPVKLWDTLFYAAFAVMVTTSVGVVGVLPVFSFLIVPAVIGSMFADSFSARLWIGWGVSAAVSVLGMVLSYKLDLPTAATVVCTFGGVLLLAGLGSLFLRRPAA